MKIGDTFRIHEAVCRYEGRRSVYADGSGPQVDIISIPAIILPSGEPVTYAHTPGTWEHRINENILRP